MGAVRELAWERGPVLTPPARLASAPGQRVSLGSGSRCAPSPGLVYLHVPVLAGSTSRPPLALGLCPLAEHRPGKEQMLHTHLPSHGASEQGEGGGSFPPGSGAAPRWAVPPALQLVSHRSLPATADEASRPSENRLTLLWGGAVPVCHSVAPESTAPRPGPRRAPEHRRAHEPGASAPWSQSRGGAGLLGAGSPSSERGAWWLSQASVPTALWATLPRRPQEELESGERTRARQGDREPRRAGCQLLAGHRGTEPGAVGASSRCPWGRKLDRTNLHMGDEAVTRQEVERSFRVPNGVQNLGAGVPAPGSTAWNGAGCLACTLPFREHLRVFVPPRPPPRGRAGVRTARGRADA